MRTRRIILNNDFFNIFQIEPPVEDQDIYDAVDKIADTQVDTLALYVPGCFGRSLLDQDLVELYNHPEGDTCLKNLHALTEEGKDPFLMVLERAKVRGLEFFASLRMNDTHYKDQTFSPFLDQFYYDNLHNRIGPTEGRLNTEYDYRKSEVRSYYFEIIRETVEKYDIDGFELDFTRNCFFFPRDYPEECAPVMTQFVREVRALLTEWGEKRGKPILLSAVVPHGLSGCRKEGLDLPAWARLGLLDIVCLSTPFLARLDHDIHDSRLKLLGVQVYGGCDRNFSYGFDGAGRVVPMHTYRAMALNYLRQGADGTYLYNVMSWTMNFAKASEAVKRHGGQGDTQDRPIDYDRGLMDEVGSIETLKYLDKLYLLSHGEGESSEGLPVTVPAGGEVTLRLSVGDDIAEAAAEDRIDRICLQTVSPDCAHYDSYTVKLNQVDLSRQYAFVPFAQKPENVLLFPEPGRTGPLPEPENVRRHPVRPVDLQMGINFITIKSYREALTISDVELGIYYRESGP